MKLDICGPDLDLHVLLACEGAADNAVKDRFGTVHEILDDSASGSTSGTPTTLVSVPDEFASCHNVGALAGCATYARRY
jgi:hypothetical protein